MKIASLLAQFLYNHKRLDLPGIGSFVIGEIAETPELNKGAGTLPGETISFISNPGLKESPDLVSYISSETGKMKALAEADLESYLEQARQFLNIGKPFLFDGIGTIARLQNGQYLFTAGNPVYEKATLNVTENTDVAFSEEQNAGFKSIFYTKKANTGARKLLIISLLLSGVLLATWAGYKIYKNSLKDGKDQKQEIKNINPAQTESIGKPPVNAETNEAKPSIPSAAPGYFKFIVETTDKERGLKRYNRLKTFGLDVRLETQDSAVFKIYFLLPATPADTTRLLDSLKRLYTPAGRTAYVEQ